MGKPRTHPPGEGSSRWLQWRKRFQLAAGIYVLGWMIYSQWGFYLHPERALPDIFLNLPLWLDPLAMTAKLIASRVLVPLELLFLVTVVLTLLFGRVWCGWFCPLGTIQDWTASRSKKASLRDLPARWRTLKYGLLILILGLAAFSNLSLLVFDPLTVVYRSLTASLLPALNQIMTVFEKGIYRLGFFRQGIVEFDSWIRPRILPLQPDQFQAGAIYGVIFLAILALNLYLPRFYCRYLCPLGGLLGLLSKVSLFKPRIKEDCSSCGLCAASCPTAALQKNKSLEVHPSECIMCLECPTACSRSAVQITAGGLSWDWGAYDADRRSALISLAAVAVGAGTLGTGLAAKLSRPHLLRPPGASEEDLLQRCLRCGECAAACPTNAIQLSIFESGLVGLWTPVLVPRIGPCDFSCNACGQVCPAGAIPFLDLAQKQTRVIGKAYLNHDRCIAWADQRDCIVCEEMCPLPEKAISLEERTVKDPQGGERTILLPMVDRARCIGCGICENKCPLSGEAAIRVYLPPTAPGLYNL